MESVEATMEFEWDIGKAHSNAEKHGISFAEAMTVFGDPLEVTIPDPDHSEGEARFLSLGLSTQGRLPVVAYSEKSADPAFQRQRSGAQTAENL